MKNLKIVTGVTLGFALAQALANPSAAIEDARVERTVDGRVIVQWRSVPSDAPVDVAIGSRLLSDDDRDGRHELTQADAARRPLVRLTTANGNVVTAAERVLPLEGGRNFRDLGGYRTSDGQRVKWGKLFRSGTMARLTDADYELLSTLGIRVICDFRANDEREQEPTVWRTSGAKPKYHARDYVTAESSLRAMFGEGMPSAETVRVAMTQFYRETAYEHADSYRTMFKSLAKGEAPLAFNCSAGKDRTGVGAALLLTMLGVPRATVLEDYAMSERVVNYETEYATNAPSEPNEKPSAWDFLTKLPPEVRAPLLRSDPEYLRAALAAIEEREGSIEAYFDRVLSISKAERTRIRELLLERAS